MEERKTEKLEVKMRSFFVNRVTRLSDLFPIGQLLKHVATFLGRICWVLFWNGATCFIILLKIYLVIFEKCFYTRWAFLLKPTGHPVKLWNKSYIQTCLCWCTYYLPTTTDGVHYPIFTELFAWSTFQNPVHLRLDFGLLFSDEKLTIL